MRASGTRSSRRAPQSGEEGGRSPRPIGRNHARRTQRDEAAGRGRRRACLALAGRWGEPRGRLPAPVLRRGQAQGGAGRSAGPLRAGPCAPPPGRRSRRFTSGAAAPDACPSGGEAVGSLEDFGVHTSPT